MAGPSDAEIERARMQREAAGAFAHDLRTPLAALNMAFDLGVAEGGGIALDGELTGLVRGALGDLEGLVDDFHTASRIERGLVEPALARCELGEVLAEAAVLMGELAIEVTGEKGVAGRWDRSWLAPAIAVLVRTADRSGTADGRVTLRARSEGDSVAVEIRSGAAGPGGAPLTAAAGYPFFLACVRIEAMGGTVSGGSGDGFAEIAVRLTAGDGG